MPFSPRSQSKRVKAAVGLIAGTVATGPMTVAMILWHRRLPASERYPLPPREITEKVTHAAGVRYKMEESTHSAATLIAHFGYGATAGLLYAFLAGEVRAGALLKGIAFGLFVWSASYLGLLPATGILEPATEHPPRRNLMMIGAHVIWGAALGWLAKLFFEESQPVIGRRAFTVQWSPMRDVKGVEARRPEVPSRASLLG